MIDSPECFCELGYECLDCRRRRIARRLPQQDAAVTACSYCPRPATLIGDGDDGDFYCPDHATLAAGTTSPISV